jgi:hypothetical protein
VLDVGAEGGFGSDGAEEWLHGDDGW